MAGNINVCAVKFQYVLYYRTYIRFIGIAYNIYPVDIEVFE